MQGLRNAYKRRPHRTLQNPRKIFRRSKCIPKIERKRQASDGPGFFYSLVRRQMNVTISVMLQSGFLLEDRDLLLPWGAREPERSEERRVGKECRSRWSPSHS